MIDGTGVNDRGLYVMEVKCSPSYPCAEVVNLNVFVSVSHSWPDRPKVKKDGIIGWIDHVGATQGIRRGKNDPISRAHGFAMSVQL